MYRVAQDAMGWVGSGKNASQLENQHKPRARWQKLQELHRVTLRCNSVGRIYSGQDVDRYIIIRGYGYIYILYLACQ